MKRAATLLLNLTLSGMLAAQLPPGVDKNAILQAMQRGGPGAANASKKRTPSGQPPSSGAPAPANPGSGQPDALTENEKKDLQLEAMKAKDMGPQRFAQDLFLFRDHSNLNIEGGIADDYVLNSGDGLSLLLTGDQDNQVEAQVDGKGEIAIPSVGSVKVAGLDLPHAKLKVQSTIRKKFKATEVSLKVTKLREVRIFVMGEVYRPGSYVVPSLSSLINVLSLAGGPNALGTYRAIKVIRGGKILQTIDLYPLRVTGEGNLNLSFQNGDTIHVPLAEIQVLMEGAFTRVVGLAEPPAPDPFDPQNIYTQKRDRIQKQITAIEQRLDTASLDPQDQEFSTQGAPTQLMDTQLGLDSSGSAQDGSLSIPQRLALGRKLEALRQQLEDYRAKSRGDHRIHPSDLDKRKATGTDLDVQPWIQRWMDEGIAPRIQFELLAHETAADAVKYAGGLVDYAYSQTLMLQRRSPLGLSKVQNLDLKNPAILGTISLQKGDLLSALPNRDELVRAVSVKGWVRAPGRFDRNEGLRLADLLKRDNQLLPDTFMGRGHIFRTKADGKQEYLSFQVDAALRGDPAENLLLEDRDEIEFFRVTDFIQRHIVSVSGPMTREGNFPYVEGMRASDLLFLAGVPLKSANELGGELAHFKDGNTSEIVPLDLSKLLTTETHSPQMLRDDKVNPKILPEDRLMVFEKPNFHVHRRVVLSGEVGKPGTYVIDDPNMTLSQLIARAGGLTATAMPRAGIFLRNPQAFDMSSIDSDIRNAGVKRNDPTAQGIDEILRRLMETKRNALSGGLQPQPLMHGLSRGNINRLVVDFEAALQGAKDADVVLDDGDSIVIPRRTEVAYVVGETASPFGVYKAGSGMTVGKLIDLAGGFTRNADTANIRLLKSNGRIIDSWGIKRKDVEPGDVVLIPQRIRRDYNWQENLQALTPLALIYNAMRQP